MALFITFEGGEGSGKNTQANILAERLRKQKKWGVFLAEEPGTTMIGKQVRKWLSSPEHELLIVPGSPSQLALFDSENGYSPPTITINAQSPRAELLAFTIARSQIVEEYILPRMDSNSIIICVRYADSTTAYQGYGRQMNLRLVKVANNIATQGIKPRLTILLDMPPEKGLARKFGNTRYNFEKEVIDFHQRVRDGYLKLAENEPKRWLVIDAEKDKEEIAKEIWENVMKLLPRKRRSKKEG
jgi:dTMP kinase